MPAVTASGRRDVDHAVEAGLESIEMAQVMAPLSGMACGHVGFRGGAEMQRGARYSDGDANDPQWS
jgi:hypothetical protein